MMEAIGATIFVIGASVSISTAIMGTALWFTERFELPN